MTTKSGFIRESKTNLNEKKIEFSFSRRQGYTQTKMTNSYVKRKMNREFTDIVYSWQGDFSGLCETIWDDEEERQGFFTEHLGAGWLEEEDADAQEEENPYHRIKYDMIKKIERDAVLEAAIRPLQIKIKEMLYSPHNRRGKAFIENSISWAFEEEN